MYNNIESIGNRCQVYLQSITYFFVDFFHNIHTITYMDATKLPIDRRIKELRKEKGLTQGELAQKIDVDIKMISYYENGKSVPSIDVLIKLAETFDVTVDYLLFEDTPKRPLHQSGDPELIEQMANLDKLTEEDRSSLKHIINSLVAKNRVKDFISKVS